MGEFFEAFFRNSAPALPAALQRIKSVEAAGMAGEHKAAARPPHSERERVRANDLASEMRVKTSAMPSPCTRRPCKRSGGVTALLLRKKTVEVGVVLSLCFFSVAAQNRSPQDEAVSLAIAGEYQRAYDIFRELLHDAPDDPLLNYYAGAACVRMKKEAEGIGYLEKAVRHQAPFPRAYQELGEAYLKRKLNTEARDVVEKGLKRFPKNLALQKLRDRIQKLKPEN